ncbi:hypothetical protein TRVA0_007S03466 [Trichomonascus vanleenenianus]|uniref:transcription activator GCR1-like domain-containing protein n=1 Tax=Trichomonascus vanleenenianus TaxID=2268995 RepID=UPI003ECB4249
MSSKSGHTHEPMKRQQQQQPVVKTGSGRLRKSRTLLPQSHAKKGLKRPRKSAITGSYTGVGYNIDNSSSTKRNGRKRVHQGQAMSENLQPQRKRSRIAQTAGVIPLVEAEEAIEESETEAGEEEGQQQQEEEEFNVAADNSTADDGVGQSRKVEPAFSEMCIEKILASINTLAAEQSFRHIELQQDIRKLEERTAKVEGQAHNGTGSHPLGGYEYQQQLQQQLNNYHPQITPQLQRQTLAALALPSSSQLLSQPNQLADNQVNLSGWGVAATPTAAAPTAAAAVPPAPAPPAEAPTAEAPTAEAPTGAAPTTPEAAAAPSSSSSLLLSQPNQLVDNQFKLSRRHADPSRTFKMDKRYTANLKLACIEWFHGINGKPSVIQMEAEYGSAWREKAADAQWFYQRKVIMDEIVWVVKQGGSDIEFVVECTKRTIGNGVGLNELSGMIQDFKKRTNGGHLLELLFGCMRTIHKVR